MANWTRTCLALVLFVVNALAATDDQTNANIDYGTFQSPSSIVRPRFRYWLPDASVDSGIVAGNIKSAGSIGAGGVEFLPFYNYGGELGDVPPGADWSKYGFGTEAYLEVFRAALKATQDAGLVMDFPLGPNQGQGVPADIDDPGLQWDLVPYSVNVSKSGQFEGKIPGWGSGEFIALVSAYVNSQENITLPAGAIPFIPNEYTYYLSFNVDPENLIDQTEKVSSSGEVALELEPQDSGIGYRLFAFYQTQTHHKNLEFPNNQTATIFDNGSYTVDHYSAEGARVTTKFWDNYILGDEEIKSALMQVGNYGWEDSIEILSNISWTPSIPKRWQAKFGDSINRALPLIMFGDNNINIQSGQPGQFQVLLNTTDQGSGYINDFRTILEDGYREYLEALTNWTNSVLDLQFSSQVSYNLAMNAETNIPFVNAPECESLQFVDDVYAYRRFSGPANLAGKRVISNELGAIMMEAYQYTLPRLFYSVNRAFAGGVNQFVIHGLTYSGDYYGTTWPGYTPFSYLFSEIWSNKQPSWNHGFGDTLDAVARSQFTQQQGVPKIDFAVYYKESASAPDLGEGWSDEQLTKQGWTYSYLTDDNFNLPQAHVADGVFAPEGPAYKALLVPGGSNMTLEAVNSIKGLAEAGLPILIIGELAYYPTGNGSTEATVESAIDDLLATKNVHQTASEEIATTLSSLDLSPLISVQANGTWFTTWREGVEDSQDVAFVLGDANPSEGTISVQSTKAPYVFDLWTGEKYALLSYSVSDGRTEIPLSLAGNQTMVIAFADSPIDGIPAPCFHATNAPSSVLGYNFTGTNSLTVHVEADSETSTLGLSTGKQVALSSNSVSAASFALSNWTLVAEHWEAPQGIDNAGIIASKRNTTHDLSSLTSWQNIPALTNASGIGYYTTTFSWSPSSSGVDGAYITFSKILNTARLWVNGQQTPALDINNPKMNIGPYLQKGENEVLVVVPTTMWNYLRSIFGEIQNSGAPPLLLELSEQLGSPLPALTDNGLVGEVRVVPYFDVDVSV